MRPIWPVFCSAFPLTRWEMMEPWHRALDTLRSSGRRPSGCWRSPGRRIRRRRRRSNRSPRIRGWRRNHCGAGAAGRTDSRRGDEAVRAGGDGGAEAAAGGEHGIAPGERDIDDGSGFFRGRARPDTALMAACIDEYGNRFKAGPICKVLSEALDCGFLTPRGYRMFRPGPVSRMRARHEAPARDVMDIHAGGFSAVYGCREVRHGLVGKGRDPGKRAATR